MYQDIKYKLFKLTKQNLIFKIIFGILRYVNSLENCEGGSNTDSGAKIRVYFRYAITCI